MKIKLKKDNLFLITKWAEGGSIPPETDEIEIREPNFNKHKGTLNEEMLYKYSIPYRQRLINAGFSDNIIAGILGNIALESSFNPKASDVYNGKTYRGLMQNEPIIYSYIVNAYGGYSRDHQIQYLIDGLNGKLRKPSDRRYNQIYNELNTRFSNFTNSVNSSTSARQVARNWEYYYEKSAGTENAKRARYADYFYKGYKAPTEKGFNPNSIRFNR